MGILEDAIREYARFEDRTNDPAAPPAGQLVIYAKNKGLFTRNSDGTIAELGTGGGGGSSPTSSGATVSRTTTGDPIPAGSFQPIPFEQSDDDTDNYWTSSNPARLTIPTDGMYLFGGAGPIALTGSDSGRVYSVWRANGSDYVSAYGEVRYPSGGGGPSSHVQGRMRFATGDYIELLVSHSGAAARDVTLRAAAWIVRLGD